MKSGCVTLLISLCTFGNVLSETNPTIVHISSKQMKDIGGSVELQCSVKYIQDYPVLWTKINKDRLNDPVPISSGTTPIMRDSRFSLRYDTDSSTYTLQIKDIQETDAGYYRCQIIISVNNKISAEVELLVRRQPVILENTTRSLVTTEKQSVKLECYAIGFPTPKIIWTRENNALLPTGGSVYRGNTLKISAISKDDRGTYYCEADNGVGNSVRKHIAVDVEFAPAVYPAKRRVSQALSYNMDLECKIEAYPPPEIVWIKDDVQLANNQKFSLVHSTTIQEITDAVLTVKSIEEEQYGTYTCKATNKLGIAQDSIVLEESSDPVCPPACKGTIERSETFILFNICIFVLFRYF